MLCSEVELGIGTNAEGIIILPEDAPIGTEYKKYAKLDDVVLSWKSLRIDLIAYRIWELPEKSVLILKEN